MIVPALFGIPKPPLTFDVLLHLGTGLAVVAIFRDELLTLVKGICKGEKAALRLAGWLVVGTIPAVIAGFLLRDQVEKVFGVPVFPGFSSWSPLSCSGSPTGTTAPRITRAWVGAAFACVGFFKPWALLPGISRSGATITAGRAWGLSRQEAAKFSFLLSIPVIFGAGLYEALPLLTGEMPLELTGPYLAGTLVASVSGFLVIKYFLGLSWRGKVAAVYALLLADGDGFSSWHVFPF